MTKSMLRCWFARVAGPTVQPVHALLAQGPALALEHDQHTQKSESWAAHGDVADALSQRALFASLTLGIPHRSLQQRQYDRRTLTLKRSRIPFFGTTSCGICLSA